MMILNYIASTVIFLTPWQIVTGHHPITPKNYKPKERVLLITGLDYWTGLLDWTTGLDYWIHIFLVITYVVVTLIKRTLAFSVATELAAHH